MSLRLFASSDPSLHDTKAISSPHSEYLVHDALRNGFTSVTNQVTPKHPLETSLSHEKEVTNQRQYTLAQKVYGAHMPLRLQMEKTLVSLKPICPLLPSHNLALSILEGTDETIDVDDFLGFPGEHTETLDFHAIMERRSELN